MRAFVGAVLGIICAAGLSADAIAQASADNDRPSRRDPILTKLEELTRTLDVKTPPQKPPAKSAGISPGMTVTEASGLLPASVEADAAAQAENRAKESQ